GLSTPEATRAEMKSWQEQERAALAAKDSLKARDCRAMVERMARWLTRLENLPRGKTFPFPITLWRMGNGVWLAVENELYHIFQKELRRRCGKALIVATLTNGSRASYLPTKETYGKGIYQESIAVVARGCLEKIVEEISKQIDNM